MNNKEIDRLRELAGINKPVKSNKKSQQLDEGVIGSMKTINHVSVREKEYPRSLPERGMRTKTNASLSFLKDDEDEEYFDGHRDERQGDYEPQNDYYDNDDREVSGDEEGYEIEEDFTDVEFGDSRLGPSTDEFGDEEHDRDMRDPELNRAMSGPYDKATGDPAIDHNYNDEFDADDMMMRGDRDRDHFNDRDDDELMDNFSADAEADAMTSKSDKIVADAKQMIARGMDPEQVVMSMAHEYKLSSEEQFDLFNLATQSPVQEGKPDFPDLDNDGDKEESMKKAIRDRDGIGMDEGIDYGYYAKPSEWFHSLAKKARDYVTSHGVDLTTGGGYEEFFDRFDTEDNDVMGALEVLERLITRGSVYDAGDALKANANYRDKANAIGNLIDMIGFEVTPEQTMSEDFDNGYDNQTEVDADGYFPNGAHNHVSKEAGPASATHGDNPSHKAMSVNESSSKRLVKKMANEQSGKEAKVYLDREYAEYIVQFFDNGEYQREADYYTDDKDDAFGTAQMFLKREHNMRESADRKGIHQSLVSGYRTFKKS